MSSRSHVTLLTEIGLVLVLAAFMVSVAIPNFAGSRRSKTLEIINNLRQLDGAMQQWELDHGKTGTVVPTQEDIVAYLRHPLKPVAGERYIFRGLAEPPEAQLTRKVEGRPGGSVLRLNANTGFDVILPNGLSR
jgi:type II secretory pathway pseudopilin PulG